MTFMPEEPKTLKTDARGRVRVPAERQQILLDEFERSGLSGVKFARMSGINYATFANWVQKRRKARAASAGAATASGSCTDAPAGAGPVRLFEAFVESSSAGRGRGTEAGLMVELAGGARMLVESPMQLRLAAELLGLLAQTVRR
jgi:hypothetical protein